MLTPRVFLVPHLPTLVLDEHRGGPETSMMGALRSAREAFQVDGAAQIVALSARWMSTGPFLVDESAKLSTLTDYSGLGVETRHHFVGVPALARALVEAGTAAGVRVGPARRGADSGVSVPLHFLSRDRRVPVVPLSLAPLDADAHRAWGRVLRATLEAREEKVAFVVGGVLSGNQHAWNLRRDVAGSLDFDAWALDVLARGAWDELARPQKKWLKDAQPEARLRHLELLRGFLGDGVRGVVRGYEAAPGIGAALVEFSIGTVAESAAGDTPASGDPPAPDDAPAPDAAPASGDAPAGD